MKPALQPNVRRKVSEISSGFKSLACCFKECLAKPVSHHRYRFQLPCKGEVIMEYFHFQNSSLVSDAWPRACRCESEADNTRCEAELTRWVEQIEEREADYFQFQREGSLVLGLDESWLLIFRADGKGARP
jgi:hypothetical protein